MDLYANAKNIKGRGSPMLPNANILNKKNITIDRV